MLSGVKVMITMLMMTMTIMVMILMMMVMKMIITVIRPCPLEGNLNIQSQISLLKSYN